MIVTAREGPLTIAFERSANDTFDRLARGLFEAKGMPLHSMCFMQPYKGD